MVPQNAWGQPGQIPASEEKPFVEDTGDESHTRTAARTLAAQGTEAFENRDYLAALDLFQRAGALVEAPTILLMEARTLVELRRWVEAADKYSTVKVMQSPDSNNAAFEMAVQAASDEYEALKARIPLLTVRVVGARAHEPFSVWIDGRQIPAPLVGVDNPLDPGNHKIEVHHASDPPIHREVTLVEGAREELVVTLQAEPPPQPAQPLPTTVSQPVSPSESPRADTSGQTTLGWVALGTGAGATAIGIGTGFYALSKKSDLDKVCDPGCPSGSEDDIDSFRRYRTISYATFGLGLAGLAWGGYVLWTSKPDDPSIAVRAAPNGAWVEGRF